MSGPQNISLTWTAGAASRLPPVCLSRELPRELPDAKPLHEVSRILSTHRRHDTSMSSTAIAPPWSTDTKI